MTKQEASEWVQAYGTDLYRFCLHLTGNTAQAEDLYQDTFLQMLQVQKKIKSEGNVKSYLMGIALNLWKNQMRKVKRRMQIAPETDFESAALFAADESNDPLSASIENEEQRMIREALNRLPEKQRVVMFLYYSQEMSLQEIAHLLHIPKGTVGSRLNKAKKRLREELEGYDYAAEY